MKWGVTLQGVSTHRMTPISCKRPTLLEPKAIGTSFVTNFLGPKNHIAVFTFAGDVYVAHEDNGHLTIRTSDGKTMNNGLAYRFIEHHLTALKEGRIPSRLSSVLARVRASA